MWTNRWLRIGICAGGAVLTMAGTAEAATIRADRGDGAAPMALPRPAVSLPNAAERAGGDSAAVVYDVELHHFQYSPSDLTIDLGSIVRWANMDSVTHTVTSQFGPGTLVPSGLFDSGDLDPGESFDFQFDEPGDFYYYCIPHGSAMQAVIRVTPEPSAGWIVPLAAAIVRRARRR